MRYLFALLAVLIVGAGAALAQTEQPQASDPPLEFEDPDAKLVGLAALIRQKRMDLFFAEISEAVNLTHPVKNLPPEGVQNLGQSLRNLFLSDETVHYVDKVVDETYGSSLRRVVYLAYTSRDRWIYFNIVLKRGRTHWQFTKFSLEPDRFDLFPSSINQP